MNIFNSLKVTNKSLGSRPRMKENPNIKGDQDLTIRRINVKLTPNRFKKKMSIMQSRAI